MSIEIGTPAGKFGGYERNSEMLAPPDDELTKVGPGTPCGEYLRRYWMPVAMTQQITDLPLRIRILGEIDAKDPLAAPDAWTDATAAKARKLTEKFYG